jgi:hypothetical protein
MPFVSAYLSDKTTQELPTEMASYHKGLKLQHHKKKPYIMLSYIVPTVEYNT